MNTIVVSSVHRPPKVMPYITELNPIYSFTADYPGAAGGFYRCHMGHSTGLAAYMTDDVALMFEDDCVPNKNRNWRGAIKEGVQLITEGHCDLVCLHGRGEEEIPRKFTFEKFKEFEWAKSPPVHYTVQGTLAYLINRKAAWQLRHFDPWWLFTPLDNLLWSPRFNYMLLRDVDPAQMHFIHSAGIEESLMPNLHNAKYSRV